MRTELLKDSESVVAYLHRVWLEKAVGLIYEGHSHRSRLHTSYGEQYGREQAIVDAVQELAAFPNLRFQGEGTVASEGSDIYVSHLSYRSAHNTGHSLYGLPTGKRIRSLVATDLLIQGGYVTESWSVRDGLGLVEQLGISQDEALGTVVKFWPPTSSVHGRGAVETGGQDVPERMPEPSAAGDLEAFVAWVWHEVWNFRRFDRVPATYAPDYRFHGPSGVRLRTREAFTAYVLGLIASFPDAVFHLENMVCNENRVAVRWRLLGTHDGPGRYGNPTGRRVDVLGITHYRLQGRQLVGERTVFDELALLIQTRRPAADENVRTDESSELI